MPRQTVPWFIPVLLAIGVAGALWYYRMQVSPPQTVEYPVAAPTAEQRQAPPGPMHPIPSAAGEAVERPSLTPLPALHESDAYFKLELVNIFGRSIEERLVESGMIEKIVATVDNLPRERVATRIRPVTELEDQFLVDGQDASGEFSVSAGNSERYDELVSMLVAANLGDAIDLYRRFYPLFQSAYVELGYPNGYFNDRLVEVIDHLLLTPDVAGPIELVRPHVLYEFRDPALEALSGGQKLLLRLGDDHRSIVKKRLRELRDLLTNM